MVSVAVSFTLPMLALAVVVLTASGREAKRQVLSKGLEGATTPEGTAWASSSVEGGASPQPVDDVADLPGQWLVDHARTLGLTIPQRNADDAERMLLWLEAAGRVNPDLAEAYLWLYDLLDRLSRPEEALPALGTYCRLQTADVSARLDLIDRHFERHQSVGERLRFCAETLKAPGLPLLAQSDLHRRMAELYLRGGDTAQAQAHAEEAVKLFPGHVPAHQLLLELTDAAQRPVREVRMLLASIAASPTRTDRMWQLARVLDDLSLHAQAAEWYERVFQTFSVPEQRGQVPVELLIDLAGCYADDGKSEQALEMLERALQVAPDAVEAQFLLIDLTRKVGRPETAEPQLAVLRKRFGELQVGGATETSQATTRPAWAVDEPTAAARAVWYYLRTEPDPEQALRFAVRGRELAPQSTEMQVLYGLAKLAGGAPAEAVMLLRPCASVNQWASVGLGEALLAQGRREEAVAALRGGERLRYSGPAYERVVALLAAQQQEPAPIPPRPEVLEALRGFDDHVFSFAAQPAQFLRFEATLLSKEWTYGQRWSCEVRLTNVGPFTIFVGQEQMTSGRALVSVRWGERPEEKLAYYLAVSLTRTPVLAPGQSVSLRQALDVGGAAGLAHSAPQRELSVTFEFLLDPVADLKGRWVSALRGFVPVVVSGRRTALEVSRSKMSPVAQALQSGTEAERIRAVRTVAALLAEHEAAQIAPPDYHVRRVDEVKLRRLLISALADPTPLVRAAALEALRGVELNGRVLDAIAPRLSDPEWVVRFVAFDVLSQGQGKAFQPVLERAATGDPDNLVRRLARLLSREEGKAKSGN